MADHPESIPSGVTLRAEARVWLPFGVLALALTVLSISPVVVSARIRALRHRITDVAEPAVGAASEIERILGLEVAALRGFALEGDSAQLARYRRLEGQQLEASNRLEGLAARLGPEVQGRARRLATLSGEWDAAVQASLAPGAGVDALRRLVGRGGTPMAVLTEAQSLRRSVELLERLRRDDIVALERIETWVNWSMVLVAALAGVALVLLGRRLMALGAAAEARRLELQRSHDRRARLVRGISHDLKNPLGGADAHAGLLEMEIQGPLTPGQRRSVAAIRRSIGTTVRLIEDLLHLARAERGELPMVPVPVDFSSLVAEIVEETRSEAEAKGLALDVELPATELPGRTDPARVREVLQNLVANAIRYTPAGGEVTVRVEAVAAAGEAPESEERWIRVSVSDTGPGIPDADRERVFQEFQRAGAEVEGHGLGLAISRQIASLLQGEIELRSEVGQGSTFSLVIPARAGARAPAGDD